MTTTMADVARVAGVSQSTVSHVLNGTRTVSPDAVHRVQTAIQETGYTNDGIARSLRTGTTMTVGLALSAISNPYFGEVVHSIERELSLAGYSIVLVDTHDEPVREERALGELLSRRVDAVITAPSENGRRVAEILHARGVPAVFFDRIPEDVPLDRIDAIGVENVDSTSELIQHVAAGGHRRIAMIGGRQGLATTRERAEGYKKGLIAVSQRFSPDLVRYADTSDRPADAALQDLLSLPDPPTALFTANNRVTIDAIRALRDRGLSVPDDIALVAFDDFPWADLFHPRLTAVAQPLDALGQGAVRLLLERLANPDLPSRQIRLPPRIMHRDSCGIPPFSTNS